MKNKLSHKQLRELADALEGTIKDLNETLQELFSLDFDDISLKDCEALDNLVMVCEVCGWWCYTDEMSSTLDHVYICEECLDSAR